MAPDYHVMLYIELTHLHIYVPNQAKTRNKTESAGEFILGTAPGRYILRVEEI
jgi:hypothetical protein